MNEYEEGKHLIFEREHPRCGKHEKKRQKNRAAAVKSTQIQDA